MNNVTSVQFFSGIEVLCLVLRRLAYPCRYTDLTLIFHRPKSELCMLFNLGINFIHDKFSTRLTDMSQPWLTVPSMLQYCEVLVGKGSQIQYCWGMVDGTVRQMCRPTRHQREVCNGHHRVHALKFQSIVTPNGLIANLYGPMAGRRHDSALLHASGVQAYMQQNMISPDGQPMCIYGDPAYPLTAHVKRPHRGQHLTAEQQAFNTAMSRVRQCVEWEFGKVVRLWAFLDFNFFFKLYLSPVGKLYMVGVLLTNCHTCLHGSETSQYFKLNPPSLEEYLY